MIRALSEYDVRGIKTTIGFCRRLLETPAFQAGDFDTTTIDVEGGVHLQSDATGSDAELEELVAVAAALHAQAQSSRPRMAPKTVSTDESLWARQARLEGLR
jgi:acetyl/propionyl-CoA carboxylase alpha subunit